MNLTYKDIIYNYKPISIVFKNDENIYKYYIFSKRYLSIY